MPTLLCVPITVRDPDSALAEAAAAKQAGADLIEFRVDEFFQGADSADTPHAGAPDPLEVAQIVRIVSESPLPCIVTCRAASEGGVYDGPEDARIALYERLGTAFGKDEHPPRYLDIEFAAYTRSANIRKKVNLAVEHPEQVRDASASLIVSLHDFQSRPADLSRRLLAMRAEPVPRVLKVAYRARSLRDNLDLFDILAQRDRPTIALGMGEFGLMSRILAPKFGGFLTFASLRPATTTAPGQPTILELLGTYRFRDIGPATRVYGVIGWPVSHSLSPLVHNAGFDALGIDSVYLPLPIASDADAESSYLSLKATLLDLLGYPTLQFSGCSVTIPHKENLARLASEQGWHADAPTLATAAANTLTCLRNPDGTPASCSVGNTDAPAIAACLAGPLGDLTGKRILVIGAGGVARAAAWAVASAGASVVLHGRTRSRAEALAAALNAHLPNPAAITLTDAPDSATWQALINCTPAGMKDGPAPAETPVPEAVLRAAAQDAVVFDTVYNPLETPLLKAARAAGLRTIDGASMFIRQAESQFRVWTGGPPPAGLFDRLVREALRVNNPPA